MKAQNFGLSSRAYNTTSVTCSRNGKKDLPFFKHLISHRGCEGNVCSHTLEALTDYRKNRENGSPEDNPSWDFPEDGVYTFETPTKMYSVIRYTPGPQDTQWMEEKDRNYLARILREGQLRALEPAVWYLWEQEKTPGMDIGEWWSQKLKLPDIDAILTQAVAEVGGGSRPHASSSSSSSSAVAEVGGGSRPHASSSTGPEEENARLQQRIFDLKRGGDRALHRVRVLQEENAALKQTLAEQEEMMRRQEAGAVGRGRPSSMGPK